MAFQNSTLNKLVQQGILPDDRNFSINSLKNSATKEMVIEQLRPKTQPAITQTAAVPSSNFPQSVKPATTGIEKNNQLFISPAVKSGIDSFINSANVGFADNGAYGNQAVKNARANGLDDLADSLQKQFDERERARQVGEWESDRSVDDLRQKQAAEQADLDELMKQRELYIGMMAGGGQLTEGQQTELLKIEAAIKNAWDNVKSYDMRAETKYTNDWMERNLAEIRQAEQEMWNPQDRQRHLDRLLSVSLPEMDLTNATAIARREREIDVLKTDLLGRIHEATHNPVTKKALVKELLAHGYSRKQISSWFDYAERLENAEFMVDYEEKWKEKGADMRAGQAIRRSTVNSLFGGLGSIGVWGQKVENAITGKDTPLDFNSPLMRPSVKAQAIREGKSEDIEKRTEGWIGSDTAFGNLYSAAFNLGASMADSAVIAGLTAVGVPAWAGSLALGSSAASSAMRAAEERGLPGEKALLLGTISGLAEMFFEKYSVESLLNNINSPETIRQLLKQAAIQGGIESTEEGFTTIVNAAADMLISGDLSEYEIAKRNYMASGMSEEAAAKQASSDWLLGLTMDLAGGFISGGTMTAVPGSIKLAINSKNANQSSVTPTQNTMDSQVAAAMADMKTPEQRIAEDLGGMSNPMENKTAPVNEGIDSFSEHEAKNLTSHKGIVNGYGMSFQEFIKKAKTLGNTVRFYFGKVSKSLGKQISDATGENVTGFNIAIRTDEVLHPQNEHGNATKEAKKNQLPVTEDVVALIPEVFNHPDKVVPSGHTDYAGRKAFEVRKQLENYVVVVVGISNGKHSIEVDSMYVINKKGSPTTTDATQNVSPDPTPEASSRQTLSNPSIPTPTPSVNPENVGDMGAKTSQFPHEVRESQSKTTPYYYEKNNVPEEGRADNHYTVVHRDESLHNAQLRLEQDYVGEVEELRGKPTWTDEEMLEADLILRNLRKDAEQSGDWSKHREWAKIFGEHKSEAGRSLAILSMLNKETGDAILEKTAVLLEKADKGTDVNAVMQTISELTTQYDMATAERNVDALISIIKDSAKTRKTGFMGGKLSNITSKPLEWALKRLADYAKTEPIAGTEQVNPQQFKVGDVVKAKDRGNYGHVVKDNGDGTYEVHFKAKTGQTATKTFDATQLQSYRKSGVTAGDIASNPSSSAYSFLKSLAASSIESIASDTNRASVVDMAKTVRRNGMLSKVNTVLRNLVGNGTFDLADTIARDISVPFDMLLSKFTGTRSVAVDLSYISKAKRQGMLDGLAMAMLETSLDINARDQQSKYETSSNRTFKMSGNVVSKVLSTWEAAMGYGLYVTDEINKGGTSAEIQRGLDRLYEQGKIKDDSLRDGGQQEALYRTFQDDSALARVTQKVKDATGIVGEIELPFAKVPANLADRAIDYSPAGLAKSAYRIGKALFKAKKGEFTAADQAALVQSIGRNITGTGLIAIATAWALKGIIRVQNPGEKDEDKNKAADEKASGLTGTQINLSALDRDEKGESAEWQYGDTLMSIAFLEPFNAQLTIGALIAEDIAEEAGFGKIVGHSFVGVLQALADMPVFEAIRNTGNSIKNSNADTLGGRVADGFTRSLVTNLASSIIPNAAKGIAQGLDPYQRDLYSGETLGEEVAAQFKAISPWHRNWLPIKQDVYGNDMKNENRFLNFMNSNILPGAITTYKETDLQKALRDLEKETGTTAGYLSKDAPTSVDTERGNVELTDEQKKQFTTDRGNIYEVASSALENSDLFKGLPANIQQQTYGYAEDYATQTAKENLNIGFKPDTIAADLDNPTSQELLDALLLKTFNSMAGNKKQYGDKYQGYADMLRVDTIDDRIALDLISATRREVYENTLRSAGVSVQQWLDVLSVANRKQGNYVGNKPTKQQREDAWAHIDKMNLTDKQRAALETAVGQVFGYVIVKDATRK